MKTKTITFELCRHRHEPDAACRMNRCRVCGRKLAFTRKDGICSTCEERTTKTSKKFYMSDLFIKTLKKCAQELETTADYPIWIDGFSNCILRNHTTHDEDNPYDRHHEAEQHREYLEGALAAQSLMHSIGLEVRHD